VAHLSAATVVEKIKCEQIKTSTSCVSCDMIKTERICSSFTFDSANKTILECSQINFVTRWEYTDSASHKQTASNEKFVRCTSSQITVIDTSDKRSAELIEEKMNIS
jgi:hypothetical protein